MLFSTALSPINANTLQHCHFCWAK